MSRTSLFFGELMIYILENVCSLDGGFLERAMCGMSIQRLENMSKYSLLSDRINNCAVYLLLRYGLMREYGIKNKPEFELRKRGKPYLKGTDGIYFNLSHCKNTAVCIISKSDTAIDVMDIRTVHKGVLKRCCTLEEIDIINSSEFPDREFTKLWTRKECYSKLDGRGLLLDFSEIDEGLKEMSDIYTEDYGTYILSYYSKEKVDIIKVETESLLEII